jgi:molecular chaperone DnaJ
MKNYYEILGIEENASQDEIKKRYRQLSKEFHPDINPDGAERFKEIAEAYEHLGDEQKRQQYNNQKNNPFAGAGGGFEDLFSQMFGGGNPFGGGGNPFQQRRPAAPSKIVKLKITPVESFLGVEKNINYIKETHCGNCNGSGGDQQVCNGCGGAGSKIKTFGTGFMVQQVRVGCETCGGKGYTLIHRCVLCGGKGTKSTPQEVKIKLPVGADDGQYLKLQGYGDFSNGVYGDIVVQIEIEPRDGFEKMNNDLIYNLFLNLDEIKNSTYRIPHPNGDLNTQAPKTFDTSKPLRLKGKGYNGGDMYVKINVRFERN